MNKIDKKYKKELKQLQKEYTPEKWDRIYNRKWKKEWKPFLKDDHDWDWRYFYNCILYKLEKMKVYLDNYSSTAEPDRSDIINSLDETIKFGKEIIDKNYYVEADKDAKLHCTHVVYIYRNNPGEGLSEIEKMKDAELVHTVESKRNMDSMDVEDWLGAGPANQWLVDNGYDKKDFHFAYGGEWDSEESLENHRKLMLECAKKEQEDMDKFFLMISKYFKKWWD